MKAPAAAELNDLLAAAGFLCLGECPVLAEDALANSGNADAVRHLNLIGSTGPTLWPVFSASPEFGDGKAHSLDRYTKRVLGRIAQTLACEVYFPFEGPPYRPFQQWALRSGGFSRSPLGVLAHTQYGPWTGFRGAFVSTGPIPDQGNEFDPGPCGTCADKPCLSACPVDAISETLGYDVPRCRSHLAKSNALDCWSGCLARRACPFGSEHAPTPDNARFHMESFVRL